MTSQAANAPLVEACNPSTLDDPEMEFVYPLMARVHVIRARRNIVLEKLRVILERERVDGKREVNLLLAEKSNNL